MQVGLHYGIGFNYLIIKEMSNDTAIMQIMQPVRDIDLMVMLDIINDTIPMNTKYKLNNISILCLRTYINDIIIGYTKDYLSGGSVETIKSVYEELTGIIICLKNTNNNINNTIKELFILLDELIEKIPMGIELEFIGKNIVCFNTIIKEASIGLKTNPRDTYWQSCIIEIYRILDLNGVKGFNGKY